MILFNMITLDGFFAGPQGEIDWHNVDAEFNDFAIEQLDSMDILLFGRVTYAWMAGYWPTQIAIQNDPVVAGKMNVKSKVVFSKTLDKADWNNTRLIKKDIDWEISKLKGQPGKDLIIFGSGNLAVDLANLGLIDEYRLMLNPVVLGKGRGLFEGIDGKLKLKLIKTREFRSGNVLLHYRPSGK